MHPFVYSASLPTTGAQDVTVLYVVQRRHKAKKVDVHSSSPRTPDLLLSLEYETPGREDVNTPTRGSFMSSFSSQHVAIPTLCNGPRGRAGFAFRPERMASLKSDTPPLCSWRFLYRFDIKILRSDRDKYEAVSHKNMYTQRKTMMEETSTSRPGKVNHYYRSDGAVLGRLHGLTDDQLKAIGLWELKVLQQHYCNLIDVEAVCKLSGFEGAKTFTIGRSNARISDFVSICPDSASFFKAFLPQVNVISLSGSDMSLT